MNVLQKAVVAAAGAASLPRAKRLIVGVSPASSLRMAVDHYVRQAEHVLPVRARPGLIVWSGRLLRQAGVEDGGLCCACATAQVHLYQAELVVLLHGAPTKRVVPFAAFVEVGPSTSTMMLVRSGHYAQGPRTCGQFLSTAADVCALTRIAPPSTGRARL